MPKLSIVVPTRERADTLIHTLRTLVTQSYTNCEFLISDNASGDGTNLAVASFSDPRIRYLNTGVRLSMSDNWQFALGHCQGEFITYIGDDDGFLPEALSKAMSLIEDSQLDALVWKQPAYFWPGYIQPDRQNSFWIRPARMRMAIAHGRAKLKQVMRFHEAYTALPSLYNGIVRKTLVDRAATQSQNGVFFNSICPDVFSGVALGALIGPYLLSDYPFSVMGNSHHSTGGSFLHAREDASGRPASLFFSENTRQYDERIIVCPTSYSILMGEYLRVRSSIPGLNLPEPNWAGYVRALIRSSRHLSHPDEILRSASHTAKTVGLRMSLSQNSVLPPSKPATGMSEDILKFKAPVDMVGNIYDACRLLSGMLPPQIECERENALVRFIRNTREFVMVEAKILYRSL